jgi:hypothetical protein
VSAESTTPPESAGGSPSARDVRAWANQNGWTLGPDDPITPDIEAAYEAAHP